MKTPLRRRLTGHYSVASALEHMGPELRVQPDANLGLQDLPSAVLFLHSFLLSLAEAKNLGQKSPQPQMLHTASASALLTFTSPVDITLTYLSGSFTSCSHHSEPLLPGHEGNSVLIGFPAFTVPATAVLYQTPQRACPHLQS